MFLFSALQLLTLFTAFIFSLTHQIPTSLAKATANVNITERLFWSTQPEFTLLNLALSFMPNSLAIDPPSIGKSLYCLLIGTTQLVTELSFVSIGNPMLSLVFAKYFMIPATLLKSFELTKVASR
jgi:hypothetical protein